MLTRLLGTGVSLVAGLIGTKLIGAVWKGTTGEEPPTKTNPEAQQNTTLGKVLTFAIVSGATAAVIQAVTNRWTQKMADNG